MHAMCWDWRYEKCFIDEKPANYMLYSFHPVNFPENNLSWTETLSGHTSHSPSLPLLFRYLCWLSFLPPERAEDVFSTRDAGPLSCSVERGGEWLTRIAKVNAADVGQTVSLLTCAGDYLKQQQRTMKIMCSGFTWLKETKTLRVYWFHLWPAGFIY